MSNNYDSGISCFLKSCCNCLCINRYTADSVNTLRDQIFQHSVLFCSVAAFRVDFVCIYIIMICIKFVYTSTHIIKPCNTFCLGTQRDCKFFIAACPCSCRRCCLFCRRCFFCRCRLFCGRCFFCRRCSFCFSAAAAANQQSCYHCHAEQCT